MRLNYETILVGDHAILVPYRKEHVLRYHQWMQDAALLEATGSEPLSLQEEYDMQISWREDNDKCTFIVLAREAVSRKSLEKLLLLLPPGQEEDSKQKSSKDSFVFQSRSAMVGDVNVFLSYEEEDDDAEKESGESVHDLLKTTTYQQAELDIMIAEKSFQRKGIGREASCMMMLYIAQHLNIRRIFCKINEDNKSSIWLFRKLGFEQCSYAACFRQFEFELKRGSPEELVDTLSCLLGGRELITCQSPLVDEYGVDESDEAR